MSELPTDLRTLRIKLQKLANAVGQPFDENILDDAAREIERLRHAIKIERGKTEASDEYAQRVLAEICIAAGCPQEAR